MSTFVLNVLYCYCLGALFPVSSVSENIKDGNCYRKTTKTILSEFLNVDFSVCVFVCSENQLQGTGTASPPSLQLGFPFCLYCHTTEEKSPSLHGETP